VLDEDRRLPLAVALPLGGNAVLMRRMGGAGGAGGQEQGRQEYRPLGTDGGGGKRDGEIAACTLV